MKSWIIVLAVAFLAAGAARADMTWDVKTETTLKVGSETRALPPAATTYVLKSNVLRVDAGEEQPTRFINAANNSVVLVSYPDSTFLTMDFNLMVSTMASEREQMRAKLPAMEAAAAQLPPERRPEQEALVQAQKRKYELWSQPYSVRATTETATISGYSCIKYEGVSGSEVFQEIWVSQDIIPDANYYYQAVARLEAYDSQRYSSLARVRSFPVKVVSHYGPVTVTDTVTRYDNSSVPADAFIIPDDFRESDAVSKRNQ